MIPAHEIGIASDELSETVRSFTKLTKRDDSIEVIRSKELYASEIIEQATETQRTTKDVEGDAVVLLADLKRQTAMGEPTYQITNG